MGYNHEDENYCCLSLPAVSRDLFVKIHTQGQTHGGLFQDIELVARPPPEGRAPSHCPSFCGGR